MEFSSAVRRAGPSLVRQMAELDRMRIQLGELPSWIEHGLSSAVRRAGPIRFGERRAGSIELRLHLVLVTPLSRLHRTHYCFVSVGGIIGTLRFKNRKNSFFLEEHSD